jgi:hypothetical protein
MAGWRWRPSRPGWYALGGLVVAVVLGAILVVLGPGALLLALAFLALVSAIVWLWSSLLALDSDTPLTLDEALAMVVPTAEEERKQSVLRALKDLEYERVVGKISGQDFATLVTRYRREAKELLYLIDQGNSADLGAAEAELAERLREEGLLTAGAANPDGQRHREEPP